MSPGEYPFDNAVTLVLRAIDALQSIQRYLHPALLTKLVDKSLELEVAVVELSDAIARDAEREPDSPIAAVHRATHLTARALNDLKAAPSSPDGIFVAYKALRYLPWAMENVYSLTRHHARVNEFFGGPISTEAPNIDSGVFHFDNERGTKGGYSLFVPETIDDGHDAPIVFALHGGAGHGRGFLWTWLKDARARQIVLVTPTSRGDTWSLMNPAVDIENLDRILHDVAQRWPISAHKRLLTGMSDGGTFTYLAGLKSDSPFTHLAPISATFHPMLIEMVSPLKVQARDLFITHGVHDWMFPVDSARLAKETLAGLGANVRYDEVSDLAHTYPREKNVEILDWFLG